MKKPTLFLLVLTLIFYSCSNTNNSKNTEDIQTNILFAPTKSYVEFFGKENYINLQYEELKVRLRREEIFLENINSSIYLNISINSIFQLKSDSLKKSSHNFLKNIALVLSKYPQSKILIKVYASKWYLDNAIIEKEKILSFDRSNMLRNFFISNGIASNRIEIINDGDKNTNFDTIQDKFQELKRRVEILIL